MIQGKMIYGSLSAILGIIVVFYSFHWLSLLLCVVFLYYLNTKLPKTFFIGCMITLFVFATYFFIIESLNKSHFSSADTSIVGKIITVPQINGDKFLTTVKTSQKEKVLLSYKIQTRKEKEILSKIIKVGAICKFEGAFKEPPSARNPNAFNYKQYLYFQNIHWIFTPRKINLQHCTKPSFSIKNILLNVRKKGITYIENNFPPTSAAFVEALLFGEQNHINEQIMASYQSLGIIHILAISGSHVSLLVSMIFLIGIRIGITRERMFLFLFLLIPVYVLLAGASPSVIRAGLMTMIGIVVFWFPHYVNPLDALSIACMLMLFIQPYYVFHAGFQLSFLVTGALLLSVNLILKSNGGYFKQIWLVTLIAQLIVFPLILYYFYEISLLSLIANLIFIPLFSFVILPMAIFSYLFHLFFPSLGEFFIVFLSFIIDSSNDLSLFLMKFQFLTLCFGKPPQFMMMIYYLIIIFIFVSWEKQKSIFIPLLCLLFVLVIHWNVYSFIPKGTVTIIDVGQGDSILIELPYRKSVYLIDTGGTASFGEKEDWQIKHDSFSVGKDVLLPFLKSKGIRKIDKLILTHGDTDHIGSVSDVISEIKINEVYFPKNSSYDNVEKNLFNEIARAKIPLKQIEKGDEWFEGGVPFFILGPNGNEQKQNNRSIIILTKLGGVSWLLTGDLEMEGEEKLLQEYPNLDIDILKIAHHGSKTSTGENFLHKLTPSIALISVGEQNRFHHPHPDVIKRLKNRGIHILRTDIHGAIQFHFTKNSGTFSTQLPYDVTK